MRSALSALLLLALTVLPARGDGSGYLGVVLGRLPADGPRGALVQEIFQDSPADRGGLRVGDLVQSVNGGEVADAQGFLDKIQPLKNGEKAQFVLQRAGEMKKIDVSLAPRPEQPLAELPLKPRPTLGIAFAIQPDGRLAVARFLPESAAEAAGLKEGDIIMAFAGRDVNDYPAMLSLAAAQKDGDEVKIQITRDGQAMDLTLKIKVAVPALRPGQP